MRTFAKLNIFGKFNYFEIFDKKNFKPYKRISAAALSMY
jgi:hypothetical protein